MISNYSIEEILRLAKHKHPCFWEKVTFKRNKMRENTSTVQVFSERGFSCNAVTSGIKRRCQPNNFFFQRNFLLPDLFSARWHAWSNIPRNCSWRENDQISRTISFSRPDWLGLGSPGWTFFLNFHGNSCIHSSHGCGRACRLGHKLESPAFFEDSKPQRRQDSIVKLCWSDWSATRLKFDFSLGNSKFMQLPIFMTE